MITTRIIEAGFDIDTGVSAYRDIRGFITKRFRDTFVGKCYKKCLILDLIRIVDWTHGTITQDGIPDISTIGVLLEIKCMIFAVDELLHGCRVLSVNNETNSILCTFNETAYGFVYIPSPSDNKLLNELASSLTSDQLITVRVTAASYPIGVDRIGFCATVYAPTAKFVGYKIANVREFNAELLSVYKTFSARYALDNDASNFAKFTEFLTATSGVKDDIVTKFNSGCSPDTSIVYRNSYLFGKPEFFTARGAIDSSLHIETYASLSSNAIAVKLINEYFSELNLLHEYNRLYTTKTLFDAHNNVWRGYRRLKDK